MDRSAFERVVDKLVGAKHIYILGVRSSSFLAGYLNFYFHLIFDNVTLVTSNSAGDILESILRIGPGDVLIGISFPRYSQSTVKGVRFAHDRGADVVAITDSALSPLYPMASVSLLASSDMISFVDSLVAPLEPAQRPDRGGRPPEGCRCVPDFQPSGGNLGGIRRIWTER